MALVSENNANGRRYWYAGIFGMLFVMSRYFSPDFVDNELAYTMGPLRVADPGFLANDPFVTGISSTFFVYSHLVSFLYRTFEVLPATIICRVAIWTFQIWCLVRLLRTIGLTWWASCLLFVFWINTSQNVAAGEWVIECATGKPVAYGFLFLALDNLLRRRPGWAGACAGAAVSFHVAVGIWASAALGCAALFSAWRERRFADAAAFLLPAVLCGVPGLFSVFSGGAFGQEAAVGAEVARVSVTWANPFHLDPHYFLQGHKLERLLLYLAVTLILLAKFARRETVPTLITFLLGLFAIFSAGVIARHFDLYSFLQYYPFRVLDGMLPLVFWASVLLLVQAAHLRIGSSSLAFIALSPLLIGSFNYCYQLFRPAQPFGWSLDGMASTALKTEPRLTAYHVRERVREWTAYLGAGDGTDASFREPPDLERMHGWIRERTPVAATFIIPLDDYRFSLHTGRSSFVSPVYAPVDGRLLQWKERMEALNRGPVSGVGFEIVPEISRNYLKLTGEDLSRIGKRYGATYFLTTSDATPGMKPVHQSGKYRLYRL